MTAPDLVATIGAATANAFLDADEADEYLASRLNVSAWDAASSDNRDRALIEATRELTLLPWAGYVVTATQALAWPREYAPNPDAPADASVGASGAVEYLTTEIPLRVRHATAELALAFLKSGTIDLAVADAGLGVIRKKIDVLETEWASGARPVGLARFPRVLGLVRPLLAPSAIGVEVIRS